MNQNSIPQNKSEQLRKTASLKRIHTFFAVSTFILAIAAILLLIGTLVVVIMYELGEHSAARDNLLYILAGTFAGGAIALALAAFGMNILSRGANERELDFRERCDGEESFFVGDGTLATFAAQELVIHGENAGKGDVEVRVPYREIRVFSVCTRRAPKEKGTWSVVFEIPAHYLAKPGKAKKGDPPALVQTDLKPRLVETLERHNIPLLGERRPQGKAGKGKFTLRAKYLLPNRKKRTRSLFIVGGGAVLAVAGILLAIFWQIAVGAVVSFLGAVLAGRATFTYVRAQGLLGVYEEGLWWRESNRIDSVFLKWEEIETIKREEQNNFPLLTVHCPYGDYHFPAVADSFEYLSELHPEKCI